MSSSHSGSDDDNDDKSKREGGGGGGGGRQYMSCLTNDGHCTSVPCSQSLYKCVSLTDHHVM